jgi:hypothetical protein
MCGRSGACAASRGTERSAVALIERSARAERMQRKEVVNLAFHECFERRHYLLEEKP